MKGGRGVLLTVVTQGYWLLETPPSPSPYYQPSEFAGAEEREEKLTSAYIALTKNLTAAPNIKSQGSVILPVLRRTEEPEILVKFGDIDLTHIPHLHIQVSRGERSIPVNKLQGMLGILVLTSVLKRLDFKMTI